MLHLLQETPTSVSCQGSSHVSPEIEDVTIMYLGFGNSKCAFIHNSQLDPKKVRRMTVVGTRRMIVYDDTQPLEKLKIYDARVEVPPHYDTFAEFNYSYHYGDAYVPYIKQEEPLKLERQHFVDCITTDQVPLTNGRLGLEVVRILEASSESLRKKGVSVELGIAPSWHNGRKNHRAANGHAQMSNAA